MESDVSTAGAGDQQTIHRDAVIQRRAGAVVESGW